jgi:hypothetical protein
MIRGGFGVFYFGAILDFCIKNLRFGKNGNRLFVVAVKLHYKAGIDSQ